MKLYTMMLRVLVIAGVGLFSFTHSGAAQTTESLIKPIDTSIIHIVPHRAQYDMSLDSVKNGVTLSEVTGKMTYDWGDACEAWITQQRLRLHMVFEQGEESDLDSTVLGWESKTEDKYKFTASRTLDNEDAEVYKGTATRGEKEGRGIYVLPADKKDVLLDGTDHFPVGHTKRLIAEALSGTKLFSTRVFDGADEEGLSIVSSFIGPKRNHDDLTDIDKKLHGQKLFDSESWPIRIAFFLPKPEAQTPDYEMDMVLQANGVVRSVKLDYGDFVIKGVLKKIEEVPAKGCKIH